jgi:hypothetical protein
MPKELYFFESAYGTKNIDQLSGNNDPDFLYHSYNVNFPLKFPIRNLRSISLKSAEIPISILASRLNNGTILLPYRILSLYNKLSLLYLLSQSLMYSY